MLDFQPDNGFVRRLSLCELWGTTIRAPHTRDADPRRSAHAYTGPDRDAHPFLLLLLLRGRSGIGAGLEPAGDLDPDRNLDGSLHRALSGIFYDLKLPPEIPKSP